MSLEFTPGYDRHTRLEANSPAAAQRASTEQDAALKKRIKEAKKIIAARKEQRTACFGYKKSNEDPSEQSMAAKLSRLNDLNPEALLGEFLALTILHFFAMLFQREYNIQIRSFSDALALDAQKQARIKAHAATDDNVRVAYAPLRDTETGVLLTDDEGCLIYPACYPVDEAGNIDYHQNPNTKGTASRAAQRANGFVPIENWNEACEIQMLKFRKDMTGAKGFTPEQMHKLNMHAEQARQDGQRSEREMARDNAIANASRAAAPVARPVLRPAGA